MCDILEFSEKFVVTYDFYKLGDSYEMQVVKNGLFIISFSILKNNVLESWKIWLSIVVEHFTWVQVHYLSVT